ncbi:MAG TPA: diguanylate cyclase [Acidimicrobiales bacterium]|nr:diguanylate cyclase [Acidimicrobiales bacterium]
MARKELLEQSAPAPAYLQSLLDALPAVLFVIDEAGTIRYAAGQVAHLGDRPSSQLVGSHVGDFVAGDDERAVVDDLLANTARRRQGEMVGPVRMPYLDADGSTRLTEAWAVNKMSDPTLNGLVVILLPESAYDRFDQILVSIVGGAPLGQTFQSLAQALRYPPFGGESYFLVASGDDRGSLQYPDVARVPGPPMPGPWDEIWTSDGPIECPTLSRVSSQLRESARLAGFASLACFPVHHGPDGSPNAALVTWSRDEGPLTPFATLAIRRAIVIGSLAMSHRYEEDGLMDAAFKDPLTGLANRRAFFQSLEARVADGSQPVVLYIDLDGFKEVNDQYGHLAGDAVLRVAARRLHGVMRPTDEIARLGGDEFAVLCGGTPSTEQIATIADRVMEQLSQPWTVGDGVTVEVGASIGIAIDLPAGTPVDTILGRADGALYQAKARGKGQWALSSAVAG